MNKKNENLEEINSDKNLMKIIRKNMDKEIINFKDIYDIREIKWGTFDKLFFLKDEYIDNKINYTFYDEEINKIIWDFINSIDEFQNFYITYTFPNGNKQVFLDGMKAREDYKIKLEKYMSLYIDVLKNYDKLIEISKEKLKVLRVE